MSIEPTGTCRHFVSYSGVKLPFKLVNELTEADLHNRNTFYRGYFDDEGKLMVCQKIVYGEIESEHRYQYGENGQLQSAVITEGDDVRELTMS